MKRILWDGKNYILFAALVFIVGSWMGYVLSPLFEALIMQMLEQLVDIKDRLEGKSPLFMALFIFQNNAQAAFIMLGLGSILFFVPLFSLFANGLALGYVLKMTQASGLSPLAMFIYGILPHGVFELPAIIVSGGMGLFLGLRLLNWFFGKGMFLAHVFGQTRGDLAQFWREQSLPVLISRLKGLGKLVFLIVFTLFVAAMIEGFITPLLIEAFIPLPS